MELHKAPIHKQIFSLPVLVAALGYFVDIYDLQLFNLIGKKSLIQGLGLSEAVAADLYDNSLFLWQMGGMLIGGLVFGILGDKVGRKAILFSSILIYSLANIANAYVTSIEQYKVIRLIAGFGLSGELGAAITLVSEILHKEVRGWGTMIIVSAGALGAVVGNLVSKVATWQYCYIIGGVLGLALLLLRVGTFESGMFNQMKNSKVKKGQLSILFKDAALLKKYIACILIGLPVWFVVGICIKFCAKFYAHLNIPGTVQVGDAVMYSYIGLSVGDLASGYLSQVWRSRRKVVFVYLLLALLLIIFYTNLQGISTGWFYFLTFGLGFSTGFWALFVSIAAEQFGTNIRSTVTTSVPNFVRGAVIPITASFTYCSTQYGISAASLIVGGTCLLLSALSTWYLKETFAKDLEYVEE
jgi:MFS transporter, putative metabolite:H+ symporter